MRVEVYPDSRAANFDAAEFLARDLVKVETRNIMLATGRTPLEVYRLIAERSLPLEKLNTFAMDEYLGVPMDDPRTCANLLRRTVVDAWKIPPSQFHFVSSIEQDALDSIQEHERCIAALGGIDLLILGLGVNGHLAFNEPGSPPDSMGRIVDLEPNSIAANREWFGGDYAPARGITVGLKTILDAKTILILAYGSNKANAVSRMIDGPKSKSCPASWLQNHACISAYLDEAAAPFLAGRNSGM